MTTALPQVAYAAPASDGDDKGIVDTVKGWFADDDGKELDKPPSHDELGVADRQKIPAQKKAPKAKRVRELTKQRTSTARFWQLSDGRVEAELAAAPTSYRTGSGKKAAWKPIDTAVRASKAKGFQLANTANTGRSWFGKDADRLVRFAAEDGRSVTLGLQGAGDSLKPSVKGSTVTYKDAVSRAPACRTGGTGSR